MEAGFSFQFTGEQRRQMARPHRRVVQIHGRSTRLAIPPDDQAETNERDQRVNPLPPVLAKALDLPSAPGVCEYSRGVNTEKKNQTENQIEHAGLRGSGCRRCCRFTV